MPFKRRFTDKYTGSLPENASVVRTLFDLFYNYQLQRIKRKVPDFQANQCKKTVKSVYLLISISKAPGVLIRNITVFIRKLLV